MSQTTHPDAYLRLAPADVDRLRPYGTVRPVEAGEVLFTAGTASYPFTVVLSGAASIVQPSGDVLARFETGDFIGEMNALTGERAFTTARVTERGTVLEIARSRLLDAIGELPETGERVLRTLVARRSLLVDTAGDAVQILGSRFHPASVALRAFAARNLVPHTWIDVEDDPAAAALLEAVAADTACIPVVLTRDGTVLRGPTLEAFARHLGLLPDADHGDLHDLVVVGAGPAGLAAAVYGASEGLSTLVVESDAPGGQAGSSARIENYVGFPAGLSGSDLARRAHVQATRFGATFAVPARVERLAAEGDHVVLGLASGETVRARSVVIATGARYRRLAVDGLAAFEGNGVYYAATALEARLCGRGDVVVVGGGNSAGQAALFLAAQLGRVRLLLRGADLGASMSRYLADRIERSEGVEVLAETEVVALDGSTSGSPSLAAVTVQHRPSGRQTRIETRGLFLFIGADPCTAWLDGSGVARDAKGFVLAGDAVREPDRSGHAPWPLDRPPAPFETSVPGVYVVGDARAGSVKRVASAVGEGSVTVSFVHAYLGVPA